MKFKLTFLLPALGLLASAGSFARIADPSEANPELFLVVWNQGVAGRTDASFAFDIGVSYNSFLASGNLSQTWATLTPANAEFTDYIGSTPLTSFNYAVLGGGTFNLLSTVTAGQESLPSGIFNPEIPAAQSQVRGFLDSVNASGTHVSSANGQSVNETGTDGYFMSPDNPLNSYAGTISAGYTVSNVVGASSQFTKLSYDNFGDDFSPGIETVQAGRVLFGKNGANYVLSYTVAAVPEPPPYALTLAGFGLVGLLGLRFRRRAD